MDIPDIEVRGRINSAFGFNPFLVTRLDRPDPFAYGRSAVGLYLLCTDKQVLYVGVSTHLQKRVFTGAHVVVEYIRRAAKETVYVFLYSAFEDELLGIEKSAITALRPMFNTMHNPDRATGIPSHDEMKKKLAEVKRMAQVPKLFFSFLLRSGAIEYICKALLAGDNLKATKKNLYLDGYSEMDSPYFRFTAISKLVGICNRAAIDAGLAPPKKGEMVEIGEKVSITYADQKQGRFSICGEEENLFHLSTGAKHFGMAYLVALYLAGDIDLFKEGL